MTRPLIPPVTEVPDATVRELHALYHEGADAEPGLMLDRSILDAARAEVQSASSWHSRRQAPWWKAWLAPTSAIAVALLGLSLTWRVIDEQERDARRDMGATTEAVRNDAGNVAGNSAVNIANKDADKDADKAESKPPAAERALVVQPSVTAPAPAKGQRAEAKPSENLPAAVRQQSAKMAPDPEPRPFPGQMMAAPQAPDLAAPAALAASGPAIDTPKKSRFAEADALREKPGTSAAIRPGTGSAVSLGKLEARQQDVAVAAESSSSAASVASLAPAVKPVDEAASPEAWLKHIRELRAAGQQAEAAKSLARLRARYPAFVLPEDLNNPK